MIPTIESIIDMLLSGGCTKEQAIGWIQQHMENADLRDHFAGLAMQTALQEALRADNEETIDGVIERSVRLSYRVADTMLEARQA